MKNIQLTQGKQAIVDDEDYEWLMEWAWRHGNGYAIRTERKIHPACGKNHERTVYMHREIMNAPNDMFTDHVNHNRLDNRRENLRLCTQQDNNKNRVKQGNASVSSYKGVRWNKESRIWRASIWNAKKCIELGYFSSEIKAAEAYNEAAVKYHGEFANLNNITTARPPI